MTTTQHTPDPIDVHVGLRVRERRTMMGLSQENLADAIGLTFQQVQKYERGSNRISASRLWHIAKVLQVPVEHFFKGLENGPAVELGFKPRRALEIVRYLEGIPEAAVQNRLFALIKSLSKAPSLGEDHAEAAE